MTMPGAFLGPTTRSIVRATRPYFAVKSSAERSRLFRRSVPATACSSHRPVNVPWKIARRTRFAISQCVFEQSGHLTETIVRFPWRRMVAHRTD
jgi:hypothetical protein